MCRLACQVLPAAVQLAYPPELDPSHEDAALVAYLGNLIIEDPTIAIRALSVAKRDELHELVQGAPWDIEVEGDVSVLDAIAHHPECDFEIAMFILDIYGAVDMCRWMHRSFGSADLWTSAQACHELGLKIMKRVNAQDYPLSETDSTTTPYWVQTYVKRTEEAPEFQLSDAMKAKLKEHASQVFARAVDAQAENVVTLDTLTTWTWYDPPAKNADMATVMGNLVDMLDKAVPTEASNTAA